MTLGIEAKTLPYVLKMADFTKAKGTDGKISDDNVKAALEQVLKDVPALKPGTENNAGFQIGAGQQNNGQQSSAISNSYSGHTYITIYHKQCQMVRCKDLPFYTDECKWL